MFLNPFQKASKPNGEINIDNVKSASKANPSAKSNRKDGQIKSRTRVFTNRKRAPAELDQRETAHTKSQRRRLRQRE